MNPLHNITYGLYILTAKNETYNGCVINTLLQVTSTPSQISITVNKDNFTTQMITESGEFNVSILDTSTSFDLIKRFGFSSGKDFNKFDGFKDYKLAQNGIPYITKHTNAYISAKVVSMVDVGTHVTIVAEVTESGTLSSLKPITYAYYLSNIKPRENKTKKGVFVCRICGYVYEGEHLPDDFICPICKHGAEDFEYKGGEESQQEKQYYCLNCERIENSATPLSNCSVCGGTMLEVQN